MTKLDDMLENVTPHNHHPEVDWGEDVGLEIIDYFTTCWSCGGEGYTIEGVHGCGGDIDRCVYECPIQEQVYCETCKGRGYLK